MEKALDVAPTGEQRAPQRSGFWSLFQKHWHAVITYCAVFWSFGMCVAFLGPTLLDLGCLTSTDLKSTSWVFFAQLLCSLIGASLAGYLVQRCQANYILLMSTLVIPFAMFIIPFCRVLWALGIVLAIMGLNMGTVDCLANLQMINLFGEQVPPFLQAMHFCYGFGAFVSPMIAEPFLLNEDCTPFIDNTTVSSRQQVAPTGDLLPGNSSNMPAHSLEEAQEMTHVKYAFWIMAAVQLPIPLLVLSMVMRLRISGWRSGHTTLLESPESESAQTITSSNTQQARNEYGSIIKTKDSEEGCLQGVSWTSSPAAKTTTFQIVTVTIAASALLFIFDGLQSAYGGWVYSYAVKSIADLNTTEGAYLNALFWGTFAFGRLLSIPLATRLSPAFMLLSNIGGCLFAMMLMLTLRHDHIALYVGTGIFGLFLSSAAPTAISMAEAYLDITSAITSVIVVMGAVGEMVCPVIVGNLFVILGPVSFLSFGDIMCFLSIFVFLVLWLIGRRTPKHLEKGPSSFIWCRMCCIKKEKAEDPHVTQHVKYYGRMSDSGSSNIELSTVAQQAEKAAN